MLRLFALLIESGLVLAGLARSTLASGNDVQLVPLWRHASHTAGGAEIVAYDAHTKQLLVTNGAESRVTRLDLQTGRVLGQLDVARYGSPTSVAAHDGLIAVSVAASDRVERGAVVFYDLNRPPKIRHVRASAAESPTTIEPVVVVRVGSLPDMLTFTPDGRYVLVANEGEPSDDYLRDPEGSISLIDVARFPRSVVTLTADFLSFNLARDVLASRGVRLAGPSFTNDDRMATVAQDVEPEYIAVARDGRTAWITLQENNALAVVDVASAHVTEILPLGLKNHHRPGQGFDASDRDRLDGQPEGSARVRPWPLFGMYQPDGIAAYQMRGKTYLFTANEGDPREYPGFQDSVRVASASLDPSLLSANPLLQQDDQLGRLLISRTDGDVDGDGDLDRLMAFGTRSLAIWTTDGQLVYDSGDKLERFLAEHHPDRFNLDGWAPGSVDKRSDDRGPEPEGVVVGRVGDSILAFLGLERVHAVAVFDVTVPARTSLVNVIPLGPLGSKDKSESSPLEAKSNDFDLAPEGLAFIAAESSPWAEPLLAVACEGSGSTILFRVVKER